MQADREPQSGINPDTREMVKLISELGPDIAEIARRLGQHSETVRYRYKQKIVSKGFAVQAVPNYSALGLKRVAVLVRMGQTYAEAAQRLFDAMSESCYLVAYAGTMPDNSYLLHAGLPVEFFGSFRAAMEGLKERGVFSSIEFFDFDSFRVAPMRGECYDFEHSAWDFDWSRPLPVDSTAANPVVSGRAEFDKVDLLIVKELSKDSGRSLSEIQESIRRVNGLEINYKTLVWHHANHVVRRRLISGHSIAWHGVRYDFKDGRKALRPHGYLFVALVVRDVKQNERMRLMGSLSGLPFLWSEAAGRDYFAQLAFPVENANEAFERLGRLTRGLESRASLYVLNQREMLSFTIGHDLWDVKTGRWSFDPGDVLRRCDALVVASRGSVSSRS